MILEGIHYRYLQGQTVGAGFDPSATPSAPARRRLEATSALARSRRDPDGLRIRRTHRGAASGLLELHGRARHPAEPVFHDQLGALEDRWAWSTVPVLEELRAEARRRGLWNLFLPASTATSAPA